MHILEYTSFVFYNGYNYSFLQKGIAAWKIFGQKIL